jgi:hypothetical protein
MAVTQPQGTRKRRGTARYSFLIRCFLPWPVFSLFSLFSPIWIPVLRVEKKNEKKVPAGDCGLNGSI